MSLIECGAMGGPHRMQYIFGSAHGWGRKGEVAGAGMRGRGVVRERCRFPFVKCVYRRGEGRDWPEWKKRGHPGGPGKPQSVTIV